MSEKKAVEFDPNLHPHLVYLYRDRGYTQKKIAEALEISVGQLMSWIRMYPRVKQAYQIVPEKMDIVIEEALKKMMDGYEKKETIETYKTNKEGQEELVERKVTTKHVDGNPTALKIWVERFLKDNDEDFGEDYEEAEFSE